MKVSNVHDELKKNYTDEVAEAIEFYKSKGYVVVKDRNSGIYHYTVSNGFISDVALYEWPVKIKNEVVNYFKVPVDDNDIIELTEKILPVITLDELRNLDKCCNIMKEYTDEDNVKTDLKELQALHKKRTSKIGSNPKDPTTQAEALNEIFVVYSTISKSWYESSSFYQWDKKEKKFKKLTLDGVHELLLDYFKVTKADITYSDVKRNKDKYAKELINTNVPVRWNSYKSFEADLNRYKKEFKLYNTIIENIFS